MSNTYHVFTLDRPNTDVPMIDGVNPRWHVHRARGLTTVKPVVWLQTGFNRMFREFSVDVLWLTRHVPPLRLSGVPMIATIFDLFYLRVPDMFPLYSRMLSKIFTEQAARRSGRIVATSQATAHDVVNLLGVAPEKVSVAYGGVDREHFFPRDHEEALTILLPIKHGAKPFILAVDAFNARKNFGALLDAYVLLPPEIQRRYDIVATGVPVKHYNSFDAVARIRQLGLEKRVNMVGFVDDSIMPSLYSAASLLVFPSLYEGFGLPIIEAMACGCPVITSNISSMPEAAGKAGLLVDPNDPQDLMAQMRQILTDSPLQRELSARGLEHSAQFTWSAFADLVLDAAKSAGGTVR